MLFNKLTLAVVAYAVQSISAASIYETTASSKDFSTLAAALDAADLAQTLSGDGTFTVFAPSNSAFEKLPEELVTKLFKSIWKPQLQDVLLYHVLDSEVPSGDLSDGSTATTLNGEDITINTNPPRINDNSNILIDDNLFDIGADNGVIHGIDSVLTPTSVSSNIVEIADGDDRFSILVEAVIAAGLVDALSGEGPLTVFAPTNAAFDALPKGTLDNLLLPENIGTLTDVLKYHVVAANALSSTLSSGDVEALNGDSVEVVVSDAGVMVNDANVVIPDIIASNGIIHVIDSVLIPPADGPTKPASKRPTKMPSNLPLFRPKSGKVYSKLSKSSKPSKSAKKSKPSKSSKKSKSSKSGKSSKK